MHWSEKRVTRSVTNLKLWDENPRLERANAPRNQKQILEEIVLNDNQFLPLVRSIVSEGFQYFDIIVVYRDDRGNHLVLEGNRRVAGLKLLLEPSIAPKSKEHTFRRLSRMANTSELQKILVTPAPSIPDAVSFITRRHTAPPVQPWKPAMKYHWLVSRYEEAGYDVSTAADMCGPAVTEADIHQAIVATKLYEMAKQVPNLTEKENVKVNNPFEFPLSTLERVFIDFPSGRELLGLSITNHEVIVQSPREFFMEKFATVIKYILSEEHPKITSRTIQSDEQVRKFLSEHVVDSQPQASAALEVDLNGYLEGEPDTENTETKQKPQKKISGSGSGRSSTRGSRSRSEQRKNIGLIPRDAQLSSANQRLTDVFEELKKISPNTLPNAAGVMLRVLLDLAITQYIEENKLNDDLVRHCGSYEQAKELKKRLNFILQRGALDLSAVKVIQKLFQESDNFLTLDTLNMFVHSKAAAPLMTSQHLKKLWEGLVPLFEAIIDFRNPRD